MLMVTEFQRNQKIVKSLLEAFQSLKLGASKIRS